MDKSAEAFRTISEVSEVLDTPAHVLRFWETKFTQVKPVKRAGGRRYYRPTDVALLGGIRRLLHDDGLTIRGVQKILREKGARHVAALVSDGVLAAASDPVIAAPYPVDLRRSEPAAPATVPPPVRSTGGDLFDRAVRGEATEAPMILDAPTLPFSGAASATPFAAAAPDSAASPDEIPAGNPDGGIDRQPAATLLRAMDTLRARESRPELASVYRRLSTFRDRLARADDPQRS
jgi:DNA-binding transcriptional MerR regulator